MRNDYGNEQLFSKFKIKNVFNEKNKLKNNSIESDFFKTGKHLFISSKNLEFCLRVILLTFGWMTVFRNMYICINGNIGKNSEN